MVVLLGGVLPSTGTVLPVVSEVHSERKRVFQIFRPDRATQDNGKATTGCDLFESSVERAAVLVLSLDCPWYIATAFEVQKNTMKCTLIVEGLPE